MDRHRSLAGALLLLLGGLVQAGPVLHLSLQLEPVADEVQARALGPSRAVRLLSSTPQQSDLPRQRSAVISSQQLLIVAHDAQGREIHRHAVIDPRLQRTETGSPSGQLRGAVPILRAGVPLSVAVPARSASLRVLQPQPQNGALAWVELGRVDLPQ